MQNYQPVKANQLTNNIIKQDFFVTALAKLIVKTLRACIVIKFYLIVLKNLGNNLIKLLVIKTLDLIMVLLMFILLTCRDWMRAIVSTVS